MADQMEDEYDPKKHNGATTTSSSNNTTFSPASASVTTPAPTAPAGAAVYTTASTPTISQRCCDAIIAQPWSRIVPLLFCLLLTCLFLPPVVRYIKVTVEESREERNRPIYTPRPTVAILIANDMPSPCPSSLQPPAVQPPTIWVLEDEGRMGFLRVKVDDQEEPLCVTLENPFEGGSGTAIAAVLLPCANRTSPLDLINRQVLVYNTSGLHQIGWNEPMEEVPWRRRRMGGLGEEEPPRMVPYCLELKYDRNSAMAVKPCATAGDSLVAQYYRTQWYPDAQGRIRKWIQSSDTISYNDYLVTGSVQVPNITTDGCLTALPAKYCSGCEYKYRLDVKACHNYLDETTTSSSRSKEEYQQFITPSRFWDPVPSTVVAPNANVMIQPDVYGFLSAMTGQGCLTDLFTLFQPHDKNQSLALSKSALVVRECSNTYDQLFLFHSDTRQVEVAARRDNTRGCLEWNNDNRIVRLVSCFDARNISNATTDIPEHQQWYYDKEGRLYHFPTSSSSLSAPDASLCLEATDDATATASSSPASPSPSSLFSSPTTVSPITRRLRPRQYTTEADETDVFPSTFQTETTSNIFSAANDESGAFRPSHPTYASQTPQTVVTRRPSVTKSTSSSLPISSPTLPPWGIPLQVRTGPCLSQYNSNSFVGEEYERQRFKFVRQEANASFGIETGVIRFPAFNRCLKFFPNTTIDLLAVVQADVCRLTNIDNIFQYDVDTGALTTSDGSRRCLTTGTNSGLYLSQECGEWRPTAEGGLFHEGFGCMEWNDMDQSLIVNGSCNKLSSQLVIWVPIRLEVTPNVPDPSPAPISLSPQPTVSARTTRPSIPQSATPSLASASSLTLEPSALQPGVTQRPSETLNSRNRRSLD